MFRSIAVVSISLTALCLAQDTPAPQLSAREIFYNPRPETKVRAKPKPKLRVEESRPHSNPDIQDASEVTYPALGVKYFVSRVLEDGSTEPVDPSSTFHSKESIRLSVDVNTPGYLYIVTRGASGTWSLLYPSADADPSASLVEPGTTYEVPPNQKITFTEPAGNEKLFVFLSRQPVGNVEDLMLQLSGKKTKTPDSSPKTQQEPMIEAWNRMSDANIGSLREVYSRDLIVEKAPSEQKAARSAPKNAVYVVNKSGAKDSHVVADITLMHE